MTRQSSVGEQRSPGGSTRQVAQFVAETNYADLSAEIRATAKNILLDTLGCALGGASVELGVIAGRVAGGGVDGGPATVIGSGDRVPIPLAAYINGRLGNVFDFDDTYKLLAHHAQSALAGALSVGEATDVTGKELLTAFAVGFEVGARIVLAVWPPLSTDGHGRTDAWQSSGPAPCVYAACAAAAKAWNLDAERTEHAFGIAATYLPSRTPWLTWPDRDRLNLASIKYYDCGWLAQAGVTAALLAREGITGIPNIFESPDFLQLLLGKDRTLFHLVEGLGQSWELLNTSLKPWPSCRWHHYALTALEDILRRENILAEEIEKVDLYTFPPFLSYLSIRNQNVTQENIASIAFSFPHAAAMLSLKVPPGPDWFAPSIVLSEEAVSLRRLVVTGAEPMSLNPQSWGLGEGVVKVPSRAVVVARGRIFSEVATFARGDPWSPHTRFEGDTLVQKFRRQALVLAPRSERWHEQVEQLIQTVSRLEDLPGAKALGRLLCCEDKKAIDQ